MSSTKSQILPLQPRQFLRNSLVIPRGKRYPWPLAVTLLTRLAACSLICSLLLRLLLFVQYARPTGAPFSQLPPTLFFGALNDGVTLLSLLAPLALVLFSRQHSWPQSGLGKGSLAGLLWAVLNGLCYLAVVEYFFFQEFNARFNLVAVDYLIYPHEVFVNLYDSYPVLSVFLWTSMVAALMTWQLWRSLRFLPNPPLPRLRWGLGYLMLVAVSLTACSTHQLDFSSNRLVNEITANGISSLFQALHTNKLNYTAYYATGPVKQMQRLLRGQLHQDQSRLFTKTQGMERTAPAIPTGLGKKNVVVVVEESFGCEQVDACGQGFPLDKALEATTEPLTPQFDALARNGLLFNRAYATGTRTVRGLEAITASFPPIPSESIIKRPGNETITTWGEVMQDIGYQSSFLYGGYSGFDNMREYFGKNGFTISDRFAISHPRFANIWGVSDQDLFAHALGFFDDQAAQNKPFFSVIMTTSNHSPFTFPKDIPGLPNQQGHREDGVRYADYALGQFIQDSTAHSWFADTVFVIVADHGARVYGSEQMPLRSYEIPLLILAPSMIQPRQIQAPISQMDIAPTVLGLLGLRYTAPFFGQNVFAVPAEQRVLLFNHNHDVALYKNQKLVMLGLKQSRTGYRYQLGSNQLIATPLDPGLAALTTAYYQEAYQLFTGATGQEDEQARPPEERLQARVAPWSAP